MSDFKSEEKDGWRSIRAYDLEVGMQLCVAWIPTITMKHQTTGDGLVQVLTDDGFTRQFPVGYVLRVKNSEK